MSCCLIDILNFDNDNIQFFLKEECVMERLFELLKSCPYMPILDNIFVLFGNIIQTDDEVNVINVNELRIIYDKTSSIVFLDLLIEKFTNEKFFLIPNYLKSNIIYCLNSVVKNLAKCQDEKNLKTVKIII